MKLVTRSQWGARPYRTPNGAITYSRPRRGVKLHYLGTPYTDRPHEQCAAYVRQLQAQHMDGNGWSDIGYSFVVCTHGYVYEGRGLHRRNSANGSTSLNEQDYAVCLLVGSSGLTKPTDAQLHGARDAIDYCRKEGPAGDWLGGHRDGYATACPGDAIYAWVKAGAPRPSGGTPEPKPTPGSTYTVKPGDTLSRIGDAAGVPWPEIARANNIPSPYRITPGQKITIPKASTPPKPAPTPPSSEDSMPSANEVAAAVWKYGIENKFRKDAKGNPRKIAAQDYMEYGDKHYDDIMAQLKQLNATVKQLATAVERLAVGKEAS